MNWQFMEKGETVFNLNDQPEKFFIILKGSVLVFLPREKQ